MYGLEILHECGKRFKTKIQKGFGLIPTFAKVTGEKLVEGTILHHPTPLILISLHNAV